jgi:ABC-type spermidine/putrescine transport system permease subunit II
LFLQSQYLKMLGWNGVAKASGTSWGLVAGIVVGSTLLAVLAGVAVHKWRLRRTMQNEIHAIMYAPSPSPSCRDFRSLED